MRPWCRRIRGRWCVVVPAVLASRLSATGISCGVMELRFSSLSMARRERNRLGALGLHATVVRWRRSRPVHARALNAMRKGKP